MAKGQKRSNREVRKPKQAKSAAKVEALPGTQVKQAVSGSPARAKPKGRT
jgi:hypothetical protein